MATEIPFLHTELLRDGRLTPEDRGCQLPLFFHAFYYVMGVLFQKVPDVERIWEIILCHIPKDVWWVLGLDVCLD